jgi:hypothetical protein
MDAPFKESHRAQTAQIERTQELYHAAALEGIVLVSKGQVIRPLFKAEITTLETSSCHCKDWSRLRLWLDEVNGKNDMSGWLEKNISCNTFEGVVVIRISSSTAPDSNKQPSAADLDVAAGIHHNLLVSDCIFDTRCRVYRNAILRDTYVGADAIVLNNGKMTASTGTQKKHGQLEVSVGPESGGGRKLQVQTESTMIDVCDMLGMSRMASTTRSLPPLMNAPTFNVIGDDCLVRDTPTIQDIYMSPTSRIEAATLVEHAVLLPESHIDHASTAKRVLLQWKASIVHQSHITDTLLMEEAHAGPHSLVAESILGPDVHVSAGEVHASVIGPNTNAHHQSLVIGVLWPLGRGNVGYGANVGSNHTGRLPDQETVAAEGAFWGLSTVIKFPVNLGQAPYSLVAAGTTLVPQRISMPFSLLVDKDILPGWVLHNSPYTLSRSEAKFANRRKAKRHDFYTGWKIVRPSVIDLCLSARLALQNAPAASDGIYNGERAVPGIGKAILSEKSRLMGIKAYTACVRRYALLGLLEFCQQTNGLEDLEGEFSRSTAALQVYDFTAEPQWPILPWEDEEFWNHQKAVLLQEFPRTSGESSWISWAADLLSNDLVTLEHDYAKRIYTSKQRDDSRGKETIPDYEESHVAAEDDGVIQAAKEQATEIELSVQAILARMATARSKL